LRHGLTRQVIVLPSEDLAAYQRHSQSFLDEYQPKGANETQLVQSLLDTAWQVNRAAAIAINLLTLGLTEMEDRIRANHPEAETGLVLALAYREHDRAYVNIVIQRQRLSRQYERTLAQLRQIQAERRANEQRQLDQAAKILKMHNDESLPDQPAPYNPAHTIPRMMGSFFQLPKSRPSCTAKNAASRPTITISRLMPNVAQSDSGSV
jgi:hypothetical protein